MDFDCHNPLSKVLETSICRSCHNTSMTQLDMAPSASVTDDQSDLLANTQRQKAVAILRERNQPIALADLARDIVRSEQSNTTEPPDSEAIRDCQITLYHSHIPKLCDAGLVNYNPENRTASYAKNGPPCASSSKNGAGVGL